MDQTYGSRGEDRMKRYAPVILRIALSLVFLWFGSQQLLHTSMWTGLIPAWINSIGISSVTMVHLNGGLEVVLGICLLFGYFARISALILALHMVGITFNVGYSAIGVRDFGLTMATLSAFLHGPDTWSLDMILAKRN